ncbi:MAG TPA: hypothetical protein VGK74_18000 [Symbiobacteriaceae bacterium]|jgi:hypothetical protein
MHDRWRYALIAAVIAVIIAGCDSPDGWTPGGDAQGTPPAGQAPADGPGTAPSSPQPGSDAPSDQQPAPATENSAPQVTPPAGQASAPQGNASTPANTGGTGSQYSGPAAPVCVAQYTYTPWLAVSEERWFEGTWVLQRLHYTRTRTETCTGQQSTETKVEGPYRLWQAVPDERVSDVSHPDGATDGLSGTPFRTSDMPAGPAATPVGPSGVPKVTDPMALPPSPGVPVPGVPGLLLTVGAAIALWEARRRKGQFGTMPASEENLWLLQSDVLEFRQALLDLIADRSHAGSLLPRINKLAERIEQERVRISSNTVVDGIIQNALGDLSGPATELALFLKQQQYAGLARRGQWDVADPQLGSDPKFEFLTVLWPVEAQGSIRELGASWKETAAYWKGVFSGTATGAPASSLGEVNGIALGNLAGRYRTALAEAWNKAASGGPDPRQDARLNLWQGLLAGNAEVSGWARLTNEVNGQILDAYRRKQVVLGQVGEGDITAARVSALLTQWQQAESSEAAARAAAAANPSLALIATLSLDFGAAVAGRLVGLVHRKWMDRAAGRIGSEIDLGSLMDDPRIPDSARQAMRSLDAAYAKYWREAELRYQAILRQDGDGVLAHEAGMHDAEAAAGGLQIKEIRPLKDQYQPQIDHLYETAWGLARHGVDAEERAAAKKMADFLAPYAMTQPSDLGAGQPLNSSAGADLGPFWQELGPAPVDGGGDALWFTASFQHWVDEFNGTVRACWANRTTDHAGTATDKLYDTYKLTPAKIKKLWDVAQRNHVDPRLLLAILAQEGTGSFDSNSVNSPFYQGNGPQPNWDQDLNDAFDGLVLAKLRLYPAAVQGGFKGDWVDYVNWYTPIDRLNDRGKAGDSGVFAEDIMWANGVRASYQRVAKAVNPSLGSDPVRDVSAWMAVHPELLQPKYVHGLFRIEQGLPKGRGWPTAAVAPSLYDPQKYPDAELGVDGFYHFRAPDYYVWRLVAD